VTVSSREWDGADSRNVADDGIVVVDKPPGLTSHQVVAQIRKLSGTRKVGHAGTLDPMATGVLVVGLNRATRLLGYLQTADKSYDATIRLGASTSTDDAEGEVVSAADADAVAGLTPEGIDFAVAGFRGEISQVPSKVSAIKVAGKRAYERVRAGEEVALKARLVTVDRFEVTDVRPAASEPVGHGGIVCLDCVDVDVTVDCSSGTYIRALARDVGTELGVGGHLTMLRRTRVGTFGMESARSLDSLGKRFEFTPIGEVAAATFPRYDATAEQAEAIRTGRPLSGLPLGEGLSAMFAPDGMFLALYERHGPVHKPAAVFVG
jgi:tRNA pseudouridine55 synthase